jgi:hypothetical protein
MASWTHYPPRRLEFGDFAGDTERLAGQCAAALCQGFCLAKNLHDLVVIVCWYHCLNPS